MNNLITCVARKEKQQNEQRSAPGFIIRRWRPNGMTKPVKTEEGQGLEREKDFSPQSSSHPGLHLAFDGLLL